MQDLLTCYYTMEEVGGYRKFLAPYAVVQSVADREALDLSVAQNPPAPNFGEFLELLRPVADQVTFEGYRISPPREDAGVVLEGFRYQGPITDYIRHSVRPRVKTAHVFRQTVNGLVVWYD